MFSDTALCSSLKSDSAPPFEREALLECARDLPSLRVNRFRRARLVLVPPLVFVRSPFEMPRRCVLTLGRRRRRFPKDVIGKVSGESLKKNGEQMSITVCVLVCEHFFYNLCSVCGEV